MCDFRWPLEKGEQARSSEQECRQRQTTGDLRKEQTLGRSMQRLVLEREVTPVCQSLECQFKEEEPHPAEKVAVVRTALGF